jgi:hypothetical protein
LDPLYRGPEAPQASGVSAPLRSLASVGFGLLLSACSSEALDAGKPEPEPEPTAIPTAIQLFPLFPAQPNWSATALDFDPTRAGELWVTLRQFPSDDPCTEAVSIGCSKLIGRVALVREATSTSPAMTIKQDGNAWHFMRRPTAISFGDNGNLGTCGEARTDNYEDEVADYSGPVLWSSDPAIFGAKPQSGQNGTHLDMLHESPFCMGIAHERGNAYWVVNGQAGALDRYDFHDPHVIGGEDHSDGELGRYVTGELLRVPEIPSHLALDHTRGELYVADTGHARIARLAIESGVPGANLPTLEEIRVHRQMDDATFTDVVRPGVLGLPSGIAFADDKLLVTDNASSKLWWFARSGSVLGSVDTGLPAGSLGGVALGPDGKVYLSDLRLGVAYRVEPLSE